MLKKDFAVYCLKYAESTLPEHMVFENGNKDIKLPISFVVYLIKTQDKLILVDAGCDTMPGFCMKRYFSPAFVLRRVGVAPSDITDLIITHAHHDHIDAARHFKNAVIHITKEEYESGAKYLTDAKEINIIGEEYEIVPTVKIKKWGGHSLGSVIVEIKDNNITHVLAGDECYTNQNINDKICTGIYVDRQKATKFVTKYSDKKYCVHTCHDVSLKDERII